MRKFILLALLAGANVLAQESTAIQIGAQQVMQTRLTPQIEYFLGKTQQPAPLVLFIQGSGCIPAFTGLGTARRSSNVFNFVPLAIEGKYAVMTVNKPYSPAEAPAGAPGTALACPDAFNRYFTLENWVRDLRAALDHALQQPWVDGRKVLVFGISEGATAAAALAAADSRVTHVALLGGSGPTQYYDFVVAAYRDGRNDEEVQRRLEELEATRQQIMARPDSATDIAWGHPYKRWSSFFRASSTRFLLGSRARVYIVSGMQDVNVPILSTESMASELLAAGHDVTMRRLPNANHGLMQPGAGGEQLNGEYQRVWAWFER